MAAHETPAAAGLDIDPEIFAPGVLEGIPAHHRRAIFKHVIEQLRGLPWVREGSGAILPPRELLNAVRDLPIDDAGTTVIAALSRAPRIGSGLRALEQLARAVRRAADRRAALLDELRQLDAIAAAIGEIETVPAPRPRGSVGADPDRPFFS
jgi:hypothetical protein